MEIICSRCPRAIILVDDFKVPGDPGYGYDDYGPGKALTEDYTAKCVARHGLATYYPRPPSENETGARRGCVVFARSAEMRAVLDGVTLLRSAGPYEAPRL
jgi:hypothetical protein